MDRLMPMSGRRRFSEQYVPYLWAALALFRLSAFVLDVVGRAESPQEHLMGVVGYWICRVLFGLFGWAAFSVACRQHHDGNLVAALLPRAHGCLPLPCPHCSCCCCRRSSMSASALPDEAYDCRSRNAVPHRRRV